MNVGWQNIYNMYPVHVFYQSIYSVKQVGEICFKNYYTAYVSIRVKFKAAPENGAESGIQTGSF